eukprot:3936446-Alexandrium_andersonii.AAC.1
MLQTAANCCKRLQHLLHVRRYMLGAGRHTMKAHPARRKALLVRARSSPTSVPSPRRNRPHRSASLRIQYTLAGCAGAQQ